MNVNKKENGETLISTSSVQTSKGQNLTADNKIRVENSSNKIHKGESSNSFVGIEADAGQSQEEESSGKEEVAMDNLPPEMLTKILKSVDTRSLFNCRLVNCQWNEISSGILNTRTDAKISFKFENEEFFQPRANADEEKTSLNKFVVCMKESKNPPFARFAFFCEPWGLDYPDFFAYEDWQAFLSGVDESNKNQNQEIKIKSLELQFIDASSSEVLIENLRDLLLKKIPHLEEFGLEISEMPQVEDQEIKLFPETAENRVVQLAHIKTICFNGSVISNFPRVLKDLLNSAVNLNKIYLYTSNLKFCTEFYDFLQPLGKFHLLKNFVIYINDEFLLKAKERPDFTRALFKLELEKLALDLYPDSDSDSDNADEDAPVTRATNFMSSLLESNKNSLKELTMTSSGFLNLNKFPRFKNLTKLNISQSYDSRFSRLLTFPRGAHSLDIFPAVCELDLPRWGWSFNFPHLDALPVFPRVLNISLNDVEFMKGYNKVLVFLCPNLKHLKIHRSAFSAPQTNFLPVGRSIWKELKKLESLEIDIDVESEKNNPIALDSCFTGISEENCQRLFNMREAKNTVEKKESQASIPDSEIELMPEREHASILDMKDLKTLTINPYSEATLLQKADFFTKLTWISEEYAFKFLPHLKPKPEEED